MFDIERTTLTEYLIAQRRRHPAATGEFNALILQVAQACKAISRAVALGALEGVLGSLESENVQGETQKTLDVLADRIFLRATLATSLRTCTLIAPPAAITASARSAFAASRSFRA